VVGRRLRWTLFRVWRWHGSLAGRWPLAKSGHFGHLQWLVTGNLVRFPLGRFMQ
jgi:hypothetical protein